MLPEALRFQVGLIDQISKPLGNIQRQMTDVTNTYRQGTHTMVAGAAGMVGAGFALQQALMPAIEMDRALGEVKSLGVADDQLKTLAQTAMKFSVEYGKSATEFVAASYQIQSAISGLKGNELSEFTRSSAILAAATKADTSTITDYMGTMYGIFEKDALGMGNAEWVQRVSGMTAQAVQMFKTDGQKMAQAFGSLGSSATKMGIDMTEQMAVLGQLSATMGGGEAATKYTAFIGGAVKAQKKLGLSFFDSAGGMHEMADILDSIQGRIGHLSNDKQFAILKDAFGSDEAVKLIQNLQDKTNQLRSSVSLLDKNANMGTAIKMASAMTDQWERLEQGVFAVRTAFGAALLPSLLPVVSSLADGAMEIIEWTEMFPNLTKYIGFAAMAILGAAAAGGAFTLMMGVGKQAMATYMLTMKMFTGVSFLLTKGMAALRVAVLAANIAIAANPIILVVGAVVAAIAAVGALIYYWDDLKASFGDTTWFQVLEGAITLITLPFKAMFEFVKAGWQWVMSGFTDTSGFAFIGQMVSWLKGGFESLVLGWHMFTVEMADTWWFTAISSAVELVTLPFQTLFNFLSAGWQWVMSGFTDTSGFAFIGQMADSMRNVFGSVFSWFTDKLAGIWETMKGLIDWIPGFGSDDETAPVQSESVKRATPQAQIQPGGAAKSIASYQTSSTNYGGVAIYPTYMNSPQDMASELEMAAG